MPWTRTAPDNPGWWAWRTTDAEPRPVKVTPWPGGGMALFDPRPWERSGYYVTPEQIGGEWWTSDGAEPTPLRFPWENEHAGTL